MRAPLECFSFGARRRKHASHAVIWLNCNNLRKPRRKLARELARTSGEVEHRRGWRQVYEFKDRLRVPRSPTLVVLVPLVGHLVRCHRITTPTFEAHIDHSDRTRDSATDKSRGVGLSPPHDGRHRDDRK